MPWNYPQPSAGVIRNTDTARWPCNTHPYELPEIGPQTALG